MEDDVDRSDRDAGHRVRHLLSIASSQKPHRFWCWSGTAIHQPDVLHGNMDPLPLLDLHRTFTNPEHAGFLRVWGAALTLIIVVATINLAAAMIRFVATRRR